MHCHDSEDLKRLGEFKQPMIPTILSPVTIADIVAVDKSPYRSLIPGIGGLA